MGLISPVGITGTPVIDLPSRSLILVAVISGPTNMVYSLNVDTGAINPGFPVDVNATFPEPFAHGWDLSLAPRSNRATVQTLRE